jgi:superfamily II DNA or RNA helicase
MQEYTLDAKPRTFGRLVLDPKMNEWVLAVEPHVAMYARRLFERLRRSSGELRVENTPTVCRDLEWFIQRFPLDVETPEALRRGVVTHRERVLRLDQILDAGVATRRFRFAQGFEARDYQARAAVLAVEARSLLLGDDVGLGKTVTAIAMLMNPATRPALVVVKPHLASQWLSELAKFGPDLLCHVIKATKPYEIPRGLDGRRPEVLIASYNKLAGWRDYLSGRVRTVIFDEVQELRHAGTDKFAAASQIASAADYRLGLSATPIYNYGDEIFNVYEIIAPGSLGRKEEFAREWLRHGKMVHDPQALGSWLREQHLFLRRTRREVGRELPPVSKVAYEIDADKKALDDVGATARDLARIILNGSEKRNAAWEASGQFEELIRQATGVAKAPHVAAFVEMILESGERAVLFGWHRAVYEIWLSKLAKFYPAMYTGSETPAEKEDAKKRFLSGKTNLLIMSLRSGAGIDGLQKVCRTAVFGELDWSAGVIEQCIGRIDRDGQPDPVTAYFLVSSVGSDPIVSRVLGLKREQLEGIRDPAAEPGLERLVGGKDVKALARAFLAQQGRGA